MADKVERAGFDVELPRRFVEVRPGEFAPEVVVASGTIVSGSTGDPVEGDETITVGSTAETLTVPSGATSAIVSVEAADIRASFTETPTSSVGVLYPAGTVFQIDGAASLAGFSMIRATATDATVNVAYFD